MNYLTRYRRHWMWLFERGIKRIKIVTDHGWLLLPGGLPKTPLNAGLTETRWGRCALIKEGAATNLLHLPWRWNPSIFIAYAPGISFLKPIKNMLMVVFPCMNV